MIFIWLFFVYQHDGQHVPNIMTKVLSLERKINRITANGKHYTQHHVGCTRLFVLKFFLCSVQVVGFYSLLGEQLSYSRKPREPHLVE